MIVFDVVLVVNVSVVAVVDVVAPADIVVIVADEMVNIVIFLQRFLI